MRTMKITGSLTFPNGRIHTIDRELKLERDIEDVVAEITKIAKQQFITDVPDVDHFDYFEVEGPYAKFESGEETGPIAEEDLHRAEAEGAEFYWTVFGREIASDGPHYAYALGDYVSREAAEVIKEALNKSLNPEEMIFNGMCLWEWWLDHIRQNNTNHEGGAVAMRQKLAKLASKLERAWKIAHADGAGYDDPFDWEFVPDFMSRAFDMARLELRPEWPTIARAMRGERTSDKQ